MKRNEDFSRIMRKRRYTKNKYFIIYYVVNKLNRYHFGISIPKKVGNAVTRNKIKRQIKEIIDHNLDLVHHSIDYVIIARDEVLNIDFSSMQEELKGLLWKIKNEEGKYEKN